MVSRNNKLMHCPIFDRKRNLWNHCKKLEMNTKYKLELN